MVKYLYHPLSIHPLFYKPCDVRQIELLTDKILAAVSTDKAGHGDHQDDDQDRQDRQDRAQHQHGNEGDNDHQGRHEHLWDGLVDHLAQRVCIVCVKAHDGAVCILVKITDRQRLHMLKHLVADALEHALSDRDHSPRVEEGGHNTKGKNAGQHSQRRVELREIRVLVADQRNDKIIQQEPE